MAEKVQIYEYVNEMIMNMLSASSSSPLLWKKVSISLSSLIAPVYVVIALALHHFLHQHPHPHLQLQLDTTYSHNSCLQFSELSKVAQVATSLSASAYWLAVIQSSGWSCSTKSSSYASFSSGSANGSLVGLATVARIPQCLKHFTTVSSLTAS